jgi:hypothetical protein
MSYIVLFLLITSGYILGAPILKDSLQFRLVDCIPGDNDTLSKHVLEITNINETCIQVNKTLPDGHEVFLYIAPATENGVEVRITTESCSTPLPKLHLSLCDDNDIDNSTKPLVTFAFKELNASNILNDDNINPTPETIHFTGPTIYETLHHLNDESEEEQNITTIASVLGIEATGPTVYETMHRGDDESGEEHNITTIASVLGIEATGPTVYETMHRGDDESGEEHNITTIASVLGIEATGPTIYETMHHLDEDSENDHNIITGAPVLDIEATGPTVYETMHNLDQNIDSEQDIITTPPLKAELFTGPTVYETMHHLDEDNIITHAPGRLNVEKETEKDDTSEEDDDD